METLKEYLEKKKAHLITSLNDDNARKDDPILGRFLQGRAVIEEDYLKTLDEILDFIKDME